MEKRNYCLDDLDLIMRTDNKEFYDLGNNYILTRFINLNKRILDIYQKKLQLSKDIKINNLISPSWLYEEDGVINGYVQRKANSMSYGLYLTERRKNKVQIPFDFIADYYLKKYKIVKDAHKVGINFPDGSYNNFPIDILTHDVYAIDYDGMQVKNVTTYEYTSFLYNKNNPMIYKKKYMKDGIVNNNLDICMLGLEFLYLTTKVYPLKSKIKDSSDFKDYLNFIAFPDGDLKDKLLLLYTSDDNEYFDEELKDFKEEYTLTSDIPNVPRVFIKK